MKSQATKGREEELARLKALVGDLAIRLELSREAVSLLRDGTPWIPRFTCFNGGVDIEFYKILRADNLSR